MRKLAVESGSGPMSSHARHHVDARLDRGAVMVATEQPIERFCTGQSVGIGSLPHRDAAAAAAFSISEFDIATVPTLPNRAPSERLIDQAIASLPGVSSDANGHLLLDPVHFELAAASPDLDTDAFGGLTAFLHLSRQVGVNGSPVKWQFVGPVTLGVALLGAGIDHADAFAIAAESVRRHTAAISDVIADALPLSPQLMLLDEPTLVELMTTDFPIPPDVAVDLISAAMAAVPSDVVAGLHCCGPVDVATMLEAGPQVVSLPVSADLLDYAGYLDRFIDSDGVIVWGALSTSGPLPTRPDRFWRDLSALWCALVERGVDASDLRLRSLVSPECGLAHHQVSTARRVARLTAEIGRKVNAQAISTKLAFGA